MAFWNGVITGRMTKHLKSVRLVSLAQMTKEDWDILDYEALRPSARYNLDQQIISGNLYGFYKVSVDRHLDDDEVDHSEHGGKEDYYFPVGPDEDDDLSEFPPDWPGFGPDIKQEDVPGPPEGYLALLVFLSSRSIKQQQEILVNVQDAIPGPDDELLERGFASQRETPRVLTLASLLYRLFNVQTQQQSKIFLEKVGLNRDDTTKVLDEGG